MTRANNAPWFTKAGAASGIMPISHFVGDSIFALKGGGYGCLFSLSGIDMESRTDQDLDVRVRGVKLLCVACRRALAFISTPALWPASIFLGSTFIQIRSPSLSQTIALSFSIEPHDF